MTTKQNISEKNIISLKKKMNSKELILFQGEFDKVKKSTGIAYLLCIFLGGIFAHHLYLRRKQWTIAVVIFWFLFFASLSEPSILSVVSIGWIILGGRIIYDLFTLPAQVKKLNKKLEAEIASGILS